MHLARDKILRQARRAFPAGRNAYQVFIRENWHKVRAEIGESVGGHNELRRIGRWDNNPREIARGRNMDTFSNVNREIARRWKALSPEARAVYQGKARQDALEKARTVLGAPNDKH